MLLSGASKPNHPGLPHNAGKAVANLKGSSSEIASHDTVCTQISYTQQTNARDIRCI